MLNFVAIDLETATAIRSSICQIGITEVIDGVWDYGFEFPKGAIGNVKDWFGRFPDTDDDDD